MLSDTPILFNVANKNRNKKINKVKKTPNGRLQTLPDSVKEQLEVEGIELLNRFVYTMNEKISSDEELLLVQEHYEWAKQFICKSKPTYMLYVNSLLYDKNTRAMLSNKVEGLPEHMYNMIVKHVGSVKP